MLKIGLTGGIGSGKSTVLQIFSILGIPIYDSDSRSRWLQENDLEIISETKKLLGNEAYIANNKLNKPYIGQKIFSEKKILEAFNAIVHPRVFEDCEKWYTKNSHQKYVIKESALLFETGANKNLDIIISVISPEKLRIERIQKRDPNRSVDEIKSIFEKQTSDEQKIALSDYIIHNNETQLLIPKVLELHEIFYNKFIS